MEYCTGVTVTSVKNLHAAADQNCKGIPNNQLSCYTIIRIIDFPSITSIPETFIFNMLATSFPQKSPFNNTIFHVLNNVARIKSFSLGWQITEGIIYYATNKETDPKLLVCVCTQKSL